MKHNPLTDNESSASILVIDNTPDNLWLISRMLKTHGYHVRLALDGSQGIKSATIEPPDVILLDIAMPTMDGYEVCRVLKNNPRTSRIPIIFISAMNDAADIVEAFHVGGVDYITRPFRMEEMLARIENQLTIRRTQQALQQRLALEELVTGISTRFIGIPLEEIDFVIQKAIQEIGQFTNSDRCAITLIDNARAVATESYIWNKGKVPIHDKTDQVVQNFAWSLRQLRLGQAVKVSRIVDLPPAAALEQSYWQQQGIQSVFVLPLLWEKTFLGCFSLYWIVKEKQWFNDDTRLFRVIGDIFVNVLARKQTEELLKAERDKSQRYLDMAGVIFVAIDKQGDVTLINRKGCEVLGCTQEEIMGKNWFEHYVPERYRQDVKTVLEEVQAERATTYYYYENPVLTHSGEERVVAWVNTMVKNEQGQILGLLGSGTDITERKQAEADLAAEHARFEWVVEHTDQGFLVVGEQDRICYANQQARTYLHIQQEFLQVPTHAVFFLATAQKYYRCYPEEAWELWQDSPIISQVTPKDEQPVLYLVQPETQVSPTLWLHVERLSLAKDTAVNYLVCLRDVTEQMTTQRQMWTFHALISHKLNTPMSCLINSLYLLNEQGKNQTIDMDDMKEYANIALNSAHRLHNQLSSIRHFLTTSTLAHPGNECPLTHIPQLIAALCEEMEIRTFHISEIVEMKSHLCVVLSEQAISLLLRQVLENARKFHPQQTPTVEIILKQVSPREFCIQVCDDGITLSSEQLVRVWVPYYQAEKSFSGQVPGMGLGLAIVAMLLWSVGGHYHICNRDPGPGVVIDMVIPLTDHGG